MDFESHDHRSSCCSERERGIAGHDPNIGLNFNISKLGGDELKLGATELLSSACMEIDNAYVLRGGDF